MTRNVAYLLEGEAKVLIGAFVVLACCFACSFAIIGSLGLGASAATSAFADDNGEDKQLTAYQLQLEIEQRQESYVAAREEADQALEAISEKEKDIEKLERQIPAQQERSALAARELYKFQQQSAGLVDMLLSAGSLQNFIAELEYVNHITNANVAELNRLNDLMDQIAGERDQLKSVQAEANARADEASAALAAAQEAQAEVLRRIEEEARAQAEIAVMAEKMAAEERSNDQGEVAAASEPAPSGEGESGGAPEPSAPEASAPEPEPSMPAEALTGDEAAYVNEWAPRIDAYLAGSPLAGQGTTFARAAYTYGVDPRLSPAISFTESGKGAVCFLPHNAWGWGSASWDSWEEAINDHVAGLARGYGGQLTIEGAQKYCPPTWQSWYDRTLGQMQLI